MKISLPAMDRFSIRDFSTKLASLYQSGAHSDLIGRVDTSLLVFENELINLETGEAVELAQDGESPLADRLASAAAQLIKDEDSEASILLFLPPSAFAVTSYSMGALGESMLRSALELQAPSLLPAYEDKLLLGVNAGQGEGSALWFPEHKAEALFRAFKNQGLFLCAICPRALAALPDQAGDAVINDQDSRNLVQLQWRDGAIRKLCSVSLRDLEQEEFAKQWQESIRPEADHDFSVPADWKAVRPGLEEISNYLFFPKAAEQAGKKLETGKYKKVFAAAAAVAVLLVAVPFLRNWWEVRGLEAEIERLRAIAVEAGSYDAELYDIELEWGAFYNFPDQKIPAVLMSLDEVIESSLTGFSVKQGVVDIQGYAQDPAYLVELLAENEAFYGVAQSRTISGGNSSARGDRFGIRLSLSTVDFDAYNEKYPALDGPR